MYHSSNVIKLIITWKVLHKNVIIYIVRLCKVLCKNVIIYIIISRCNTITYNVMTHIHDLIKFNFMLELRRCKILLLSTVDEIIHH